MKIYLLLSLLGSLGTVSAQFMQACSVDAQDCSCKDVSYEICHTPPAAQELHVGSLEECIQNCDLFGSFGQCNYLLYWETGPDENCKLIADTTLEQYLDACRVFGQPLRDAYGDCVSGFLSNACSALNCGGATCHTCDVKDKCGLYAQTECEMMPSPGETSENIPNFQTCLSLCTSQQQSNNFTYVTYDKEQQECICYQTGNRNCVITAVPFGMTLADAQECDGCETDADCPVARPICSIKTGRCVECQKNADCTDSSKPICDMDDFICIPDSCESCVDPTPACNDLTNTCVECVTNATCTDPTPDCDPIENVCKRECSTDTDCAEQDYCKCYDEDEDVNGGNDCPNDGACVVGCRDISESCPINQEDDGICTIHHECKAPGNIVLSKLTIGTRDCIGCSSLKAASGATIKISTNPPSGELVCTTNVLDNPNVADYEKDGEAAFSTKDYLNTCLSFDVGGKLTEFQVSWTGAGTWTPEKFSIERSEGADYWPYCCYNTDGLTISEGQPQVFTCEEHGNHC